MDFDFNKVSRLKREIRISPKSMVVQKADIVMIQLHIGTDYVASLVMSPDAFKAFQDGAKIHVDKQKDFKDKYL